MREPLAAWLSVARRQPTEITELRRIATGNSRAMWFVGLDDSTRLVVRVEQGGVFGTSTAEEFRFMAAAERLGCPVAPVRWVEPTGSVLGRPFFVMDFVDGAAGGRDDRSMAPGLAIDFVQRLGELHRTDWASELPRQGMVDPPHDAIERWLGVARGAGVGTIPLLEEGAAWLHRWAAPCGRPGIVHGDPGPGNFVHDGERVIALTDWEFSHIGDPMEDWVYLVTMRGSRTMHRDEWLALFRTAAGIEVTERDLRYWTAFNYFKGACANITCRRAFATTNPAPNMALIGTALHQTYLRDLAMSIDVAAEPPEAPCVPTTPP